MGLPIVVRSALSAILFAGLGLVFFIGGLALGVGSLANPGEGFMPTLAGGALFVLSLVHAWRNLYAVRLAAGEKPFWPERSSIFRVGAVLFSALFYTVAFETVGFAVATLVLFLILLKSVDPVGWPSAILISLATTVAAFALFQVWLQVPLPEGWVSWWRIAQWIF